MNPNNPLIPSLVGEVYHDTLNPVLYIPPSLFPPIPSHSIPTMVGGHLVGSASTTQANTQYLPTAQIGTSTPPNHQGFEPAIAFIHTAPLAGYPVADVSSELNSTSYMR